MNDVSEKILRCNAAFAVLAFEIEDESINTRGARNVFREIMNNMHLITNMLAQRHDKESFK